MKEGFRQSMAWLHTWSGLLVGWVLFLVFVAGTAAYFRDETTLWMKPELHSVRTAPRAEAAAPPPPVDVALNFLQANAQGSPRWNITLPSVREETIRTSWTRPQPAVAPGGERPRQGERPRRQRAETAVLDPVTGERLATPRETRGGDFFYQVHFNLHYMNAIQGRWIVGFCAMFMLVAIISGIVTHKRIFADFFTFRPKKGQRSWLDAHNVTAVLALPYHLMITYTGLVTLMFMYMPWAPQAVYKEDRRAYLSEVFPSSGGFQNAPARGEPAPLLPLQALLDKSRESWGGSGAASITVTNPGDAAARVTVYRHEFGSLSANQASITYNGVTGEQVARAGEAIPAASETRGVLYGLHLGRFANPLARWLFFVSGLAGCVMVATGLLLWAVKERQKFAKAVAKGGRISFGLRLVDGLNVGAIAGLPLAMAVFLWANRLIPTGVQGRPDLEIDTFFVAWALAAVAGLAWPARRMWQIQLAIGGLLLALLPVLNPLTGGAGLMTTVPAGAWRIAGFDLTVLVLGGALLAAAWWVGKRKPAAARAKAASAAPASGATPAAAHAELDAGVIS